MKVACDKGSLCKLFSWKKKKFDLGLNYGSHSVRPLHPDPPTLGGPTQHGLVSLI